MTTFLVSIIFLLAGLTNLVAAIRVRRGGLRKMVLLYRDFRWPWGMRNAAFSFAPASVMWISIAVGYFAYGHRTELWASVVLALTVPVFAISFVLTLLWMYAPPQIAKPDWLRAEEALHGPPDDPHPRVRRLEKLIVISIFLPLIVAAIIIVVGRLLELVTSAFG